MKNIFFQTFIDVTENWVFRSVSIDLFAKIYKETVKLEPRYFPIALLVTTKWLPWPTDLTQIEGGRNYNLHPEGGVG